MSYSENRSFPVSGIPQDTVEKFDLFAKRLTGSRSCMIRLLMENFNKSASEYFTYDATVQQVIEHTNNDTFNLFCTKRTSEIKKTLDLTKP